MINSKRQMFIIIGVFALVLMLSTVTYAFFNYTRTGAINNLGTGRISFNSSQSNSINMSNLFPMTSLEASETNLDSVTITISGDTTYTNGEEFLISLVDVTNTINGKKIPISYFATYTAVSGKTIGTSSSDYWEDRKDMDANIYTLNTTGEVLEGKQILVGYIDNGATGIEGTITIKAYVDADRIAISDTYDGTESDNNGTTNEWVSGREVFTTSEWNSLSTTPISFKVRTESNEGIWANPQIDSCIDCKFLYVDYTPQYTTWNMSGTDGTNPVHLTPTVFTEGLYDNYLDLIDEVGKNNFLGVKLNSNNEATNAYACGVKDGVPFCIEGTLGSEYGGTREAEVYKANKAILQKDNLFGDTCIETLMSDLEMFGYDLFQCGQLEGMKAHAYSVGIVFAGDYCYVDSNGDFSCGE